MLSSFDRVIRRLVIRSRIIWDLGDATTNITLRAAQTGAIIRAKMHEAILSIP
jgi:hypothetical protein